MKLSRGLSFLVSTVVMVTTMTGCSSVQPVYQPTVEPLPDPKVVKVSIVTTQKDKRIIPVGSRLVITDIDGDCATEVKDAIMQRLVDNANYDVLTRDNLDQILSEFYLNSSSDERLVGKFSSEADAVSAVGELLGASLFIVGRVTYCGESPNSSPDSQYGTQYNVHATLQILDLGTGKVLLSSASQGHYLPLPASSLPSSQLSRADAAENGAEAVEDVDQPVEGGQPAKKNGIVGKAVNTLTPNRASPAPVGSQSEPSKKRSPKNKGSQVAEPEDKSYLRIKAAEAMANEFADKFFARFTWETVKMWDGPGEEFEQSIRQVQLGHCKEAADFLGNGASERLESMEDSSVAKYLHNYGVALLCANESEKAIRKLQAAYRAEYNDITLEMLGLAARIDEWSLHVEVDEEPEIGMLMRREIYSRHN